ncbi:MAG TPA: hypothetical protein VEO74_08915 [Thermoanaerobaculia bacterium]|nr:hypothetical protein [Thermoanaerobaculia bacterium]
MSDGSPDVSDGELFYIITNGVPPHRHAGLGRSARRPQQRADTWHLVHLICHLPRLTPAELEQMRKENDDEERFLSGK